MMLCSSVNGKSINKNRLGFTLIELSIVLVIIGLLVGGILVGRDLIQAAEIRSQISQIEEFKTAANTFKVKYGYLPGDMPPGQASSLGFFTFTGANAGGILCGYAFGNNDGVINSNSWTESYAFWSHLSDAKLIKGGYGGTAGNLLKANTSCSNLVGNPNAYPANEDVFSQLMPRAKIASSGVFVTVKGNNPYAPLVVHTSFDWIYYSNTNKLNMFTLITKDAVLGPVFGGGYGNGTISPSQAYQIDSKVDDGLPKSGDIRVFFATLLPFGPQTENPPCTTSGTSPIQYDLSATNANISNCPLDFLW